MPEKPNFLTEKYADLPGSKPVERAVQKNLREGEGGPVSKEGRVQAYLDRLDTIVEDERGWEHLKHKLVNEFAIDTSDTDTLAKIAHGLYESEKKLAVEQGRGADIDRLEQELEREGGVIERYKGLVQEKRDIQAKTLTSWLDYLKQNDAQYPTWFRYFVVRNLEKMGTMDKERGEYTKRTAHTVAPFPELNEEALGFVSRMLTTGIGSKEFTESQDQPKRQELETLINKKDFAKLYTFAQIETAGKLNRESIQGQWVKYDQGSDHHELEDSLRGKGTGWCTAEGSAYSHLQGGDFYVYYTKGADKKYTEPRVAIRMEGDQVAEVRGVNHRQELEPALLDIATDQYHALPGGEKFDKKSADMKKVTELVKKQEENQPFTKNDLIFLYELNSTIEGFGYDKDPRIQELRQQRNVEQDIPIVFDCTPEQIAHRASEINLDTKAYIGPLEKDIFKVLPDTVEHVYTSFPEGKIRFHQVELGGYDSAEAYEQAIKVSDMHVYDWAKDIMHQPGFKVSQVKAALELVNVSVESLGFPRGDTKQKIDDRALELGLGYCPPETGPSFRLQYQDQPNNELLVIGMEPISYSDGYPSVFHVRRNTDGRRWLAAGHGQPDSRWSPGDRFVFVRRPPRAGKQVSS